MKFKRAGKSISLLNWPLPTSSLEKPKAIDYKLKWIEYAQLVNHRRIEYGND